MKILKKNQLAILVIALMLITAGYLNYNTNYNDNVASTSTEVDEMAIGSIGDATLVSSNAIVDNENNISEINENIANNLTDNTEEVSSNLSASNNTSDDENYFSNSKLERDKMYSQMLETYQKILENSSISAEQKTIAQEEINNINSTKNAIMISENLLTTKGFEKNIIFVNGDSVNVIVEKEEISTEEIAQIQNIVQREFNSEIENIHIVTK